MNYCKRPWIMALCAVLAIAAFGFVVMWLWNAIMPGLTGWALITYPKALGLLVLCRILFGGFKGRHGGHWGHGGGPAAWREKWKHMSEEERAEMRTRWQQRCGARWRERPAEGGLSPEGSK